MGHFLMSSIASSMPLTASGSTPPQPRSPAPCSAVAAEGPVGPVGVVLEERVHAEQAPVLLVRGALLVEPDLVPPQARVAAVGARLDRRSRRCRHRCTTCASDRNAGPLAPSSAVRKRTMSDRGGEPASRCHRDRQVPALPVLGPLGTIAVGLARTIALPALVVQDHAVELHRAERDRADRFLVGPARRPSR